MVLMLVLVLLLKVLVLFPRVILMPVHFLYCLAVFENMRNSCLLSNSFSCIIGDLLMEYMLFKEADLNFKINHKSTEAKHKYVSSFLYIPALLEDGLLQRSDIHRGTGEI